MIVLYTCIKILPLDLAAYIVRKQLCETSLAEIVIYETVFVTSDFVSEFLESDLFIIFFPRWTLNLANHSFPVSFSKYVRYLNFSFDLGAMFLTVNGFTLRSNFIFI